MCHLIPLLYSNCSCFACNYGSLESILSMVAAGRGVLLGPQILFRHPTAGVSFHILNGAKEKFKMFLMRRKMPEPAATVDNFIKILAQSLPRACRAEIHDDK